MKHNIIKYLILGRWLFLSNTSEINYNCLHFILEYQIKFYNNQNIY